MKNCVMRYIVLLTVSLSVIVQLYGQQDSISTELNKTIVVPSDYKPQISDAIRLSVPPRAYDTLDLRVDLNYSIQSKPIETAYTLRTLKPVSVVGDKLPELYKGYAAVGFGNYSSSYVNIKYATERSRIKQQGVELYHNASAGKVRFENDAKLPAGYTQDYLYAHAKRFYPEFTATASIKPMYASVLKYGHQLFDSAIVQVPDTILTKRNIRRNFFANQTKFGIQSTNTDVFKLQYVAGIQHQLTVSNPKSVENYIEFQAKAAQQFEQIQTGALLYVGWSGLNFIPLDTLLQKSSTKIQLLPYAGTSVDDWTLRVGINLVESIGLNRFKAYPDVQFDYNLFSYSLIPYIRYSGDYKHYSMFQMLQENPFTSNFVTLRPTNYKVLLELGTKGRLLRTIPFLASCTISQFEDMYFWVNDVAGTSGVQNSFVPVYDNGSLITLHGETGIKRKNLDIQATINYYQYALDSIQRAWHRPAFESSLTLKYAIVNPITNKNKLIVSSQLFYEDIMYAQTYDAKPYKMNALFDINLGVEYFYNSVMVVFFNVNNITAHSYQQYYLYPNQRTNFLVGLSYSFAGNRE
ncbi:MAG: hypothetical protein BWY22_00695 [Bacteroidetes bacterium ADurb.Bin217]|nr:MAG: hypothetical protein BWY22_00695 [Bacteroidetes bacterium ADurb.Bin217]